MLSNGLQEQREQNAADRRALQVEIKGFQESVDARLDGLYQGSLCSTMPKSCKLLLDTRFWSYEVSPEAAVLRDYVPQSQLKTPVQALVLANLRESHFPDSCFRCPFRGKLVLKRLLNFGTIEHKPPWLLFSPAFMPTPPAEFPPASLWCPT